MHLNSKEYIVCNLFSKILIPRVSYLIYYHIRHLWGWECSDSNIHTLHRSTLDNGIINLIFNIGNRYIVYTYFFIFP